MAQTPPFYTQHQPPPRRNQWAIVALVVGASAFFIVLMGALIFAVARRIDVIARGPVNHNNTPRRAGMDLPFPSQSSADGWSLCSIPALGMKIDLPKEPQPYYITQKLTSNIRDYACYSLDTGDMWIRLTGYWLKSPYSDSWTMADLERQRVVRGQTPVTGIVQSGVTIDRVPGSRFSGGYTYKGTDKCYEEVAIADGTVHYYLAARYFRANQKQGHAAVERVLKSIRFTDKPSR